MKHRFGAAALVAAALLGGCVAKSDHDKLASQVGQLDARMQDIERRANLVGTQQADANAQIEELRVVARSLQGKVDAEGSGAVALSQEGQLLESRMLDEQIREDENAAKLARLEDALDRLGARVDALSGKPGDPKRAAGESDADRAGRELYAKALDLYKASDFRKCRATLEEYLKLYPQGRYASNAQYWIGETYYSEQDYERAALAFNEVVKKYPEGDKVSLAMLRLGFSFYELRNYDLARTSLLKVIEKFPNTKQASVAKRKLLLIKAVGEEEKKRPASASKPS